MTGTNGATFLVEEYVMRQTMNKLGYRFDPQELSTFKAESFQIISNEIDSLRQSDSKRRKK